MGFYSESAVGGFYSGSAVGGFYSGGAVGVMQAQGVGSAGRDSTGVATLSILKFWVVC